MKKRIRIFLVITSFIVLIIGYSFYSKIYSPNTVKEGYVFIPSHSNFTKVSLLLTPFLKDSSSFYWVAKKKNYISKIKAGKYKITKDMNNNDLVNMLRSGKQEVLNVSFNNQDSLEKLAGRVAKQIEADSLSLLTAFTNSSFLSENNFTLKTALGMYIPNSYHFYWNTSAVQFRNKMLKEYQRFWTAKRKQKANDLHLTLNQVTTLASIVQKETAAVSERPMVAGLYLNRYKNGWALQADPTVIFALQQQKNIKKTIKRVLTKDLAIDSPYNTYKNTGLPPGPIAMPDISSIDAVLNAQKHNYFYMCASTTDIGKHIFTKSLTQHNKNAAKYQAWLNKKRVMR